MTGRDHSLIEELLSVDVLDGLEDADRALLDRERAAHGACVECATLEAELSEVAGRLGLSLEPVSVRAGMVDDILGSAGPGLSADPSGVPGRLETVPVDLTERRGPRAGPWWRGLVAVAAAFVLFAGGWLVHDATSSGGGELAGARFVRFEGDAGTLAMAYEPGRSGMLLLGSDLPDPGEDRVYEVWMIAGEDAPVSGGCVRPDDGRILTFIDADVATADLMAVTVEPASCPSAPTTDPVLTAPLA